MTCSDVSELIPYEGVIQTYLVLKSRNQMILQLTGLVLRASGKRRSVVDVIYGGKTDLYTSLLPAAAAAAAGVLDLVAN